VIVSDADTALACAVASVFGAAGTEHRVCEWHLGRKLREHLPDAVLEDRANPLTSSLSGAFRSKEGWRDLVDEVAQGASREPSFGLAQSWLDRYGSRIAAQVATRDPTHPNSTGPVEQVLREVDRRIGDRVGSFTSRARMGKLLALMALDIDGRADGRRWADRLRERLHLAGGHAEGQRPHDDPKGSYSLVA
jgi:hypothetical protein